MGIYIEKNGVVEIKEGYYIGIKTNNQAEYLALILGFFILEKHIQNDDLVHIISDSQLLVRQLTGIYKVRHSHLQPLYALCKEKLQRFNATISHVLRHENSEADAMANHGIDYKKNPPKHYIALLKHHDIVI